MQASVAARERPDRAVFPSRILRGQTQDFVSDRAHDRFGTSGVRVLDADAESVQSSILGQERQHRVDRVESLARASAIARSWSPPQRQVLQSGPGEKAGNVATTSGT